MPETTFFHPAMRVEHFHVMVKHAQPRLLHLFKLGLNLPLGRAVNPPVSGAALPLQRVSVDCRQTALGGKRALTLESVTADFVEGRFSGWVER